jgi:hypothetical protein
VPLRVEVVQPDQPEEDSVAGTVIGHGGDVLAGRAQPGGDLAQRRRGLHVEVTVPEPGLVALDAADVLGLRGDRLVLVDEPDPAGLGERG